MNYNNGKTDNLNPDKVKIIHDYEKELNTHSIPLASNKFNNIIKSLATPNFLGSYHLKEAISPKFKALNNILTGNFQFKHIKSLKSTVFNPITITLVIAAVIFNLIWLFAILL